VLRTVHPSLISEWTVVAGARPSDRLPGAAADSDLIHAVATVSSWPVHHSTSCICVPNRTSTRRCAPVATAAPGRDVP
jgi:hypothetical protein